jgi:Rieske Fe-S protein
MDRKEFIAACTVACLGFVGASVLQACGSGRYVQSTVSGNQLLVNKSDFIVIKKDRQTFRRSVIARPGQLNYPIVIYRLSETEYSAILLSCTHRGSELSVNGDILTCYAHGSEFSNKGEVLQGPAEKKLKTFNVTQDEKTIYVQLA